MSYNGWSNYETWCVNLWLSNEEDSYNDLRNMADDVLQDVDDPAAFVSAMADRIKNYVEELAEATVPDLFASGTLVLDLYNAAVSDVDWYDIARSAIDEAMK